MKLDKKQKIKTFDLLNVTESEFLEIKKDFCKGTSTEDVNYPH